MHTKASELIKLVLGVQYLQTWKPDAAALHQGAVGKIGKGHLSSALETDMEIKTGVLSNRGFYRGVFFLSVFLFCLSLHDLQKIFDRDQKAAMGNYWVLKRAVQV